MTVGPTFADTPTYHIHKKAYQDTGTAPELNETMYCGITFGTIDRRDSEDYYLFIDQYITKTWCYGDNHHFPPEEYTCPECREAINPLDLLRFTEL
jgi:hypothetical protein